MASLFRSKPLTWLTQRLPLRPVAFRLVEISLRHNAAPRPARDGRAIAIVSRLVCLVMTAFYANEYFKLGIKHRIARVNPFQTQLATTELAVRRRWRRDKVAQKASPFVQHASQRSSRTLKGVPINNLIEGLAP